jgi:hypothetical protein
MPRKRFTNEQIAFALRQVENGATVDEICRIGQTLDPGKVIGVARREVQVEEMLRVSTVLCSFEPCSHLAPSEPARSVRPLGRATDGSASRPSSKRSTERRSSPICSKQPTDSQGCACC